MRIDVAVLPIKCQYSRGEIPCTERGFLPKITALMKTDPTATDLPAISPIASSPPSTDNPGSPTGDPKPKNELWLETRDLLQRALTEWETQAHTETHPEKPIDPPHAQHQGDPEKLQGLLQELKEKIDKLSIP